MFFELRDSCPVAAVSVPSGTCVNLRARKSRAARRVGRRARTDFPMRSGCSMLYAGRGDSGGLTGGVMILARRCACVCKWELGQAMEDSEKGNEDADNGRGRRGEEARYYRGNTVNDRELRRNRRKK